MEFLELVKIVKKNVVLIIVLGFVTAISAAIFYKLRPLTYDVFCVITISQAQEDKTEDYKYDNYYSQQAIDIFTDSLEMWFRDAQFASSVYEDAGVKIDALTIRQRSKLIKARKLAPQYVEVRYEAPNPDMARSISQSLTGALVKRTEEQKGDRTVWFTLHAQEPLIIRQSWQPLIVILIGFIAGMLVGFSISLVRHYLSIEKPVQK